MKINRMVALVFVLMVAVPVLSLSGMTADAALTDPGDVTATLYDIGGPDQPSNPWFFCELDGKLYFAAEEETAGLEIMVYDPVTEDVSVVVDLNPTGHANVRDLTAHEGKLYFQAHLGDYNAELWVYDPATGQTNSFELNPTAGSFPTNMFSASNGMLYFRHRFGSGNDQELTEFDPETGQYTIYDFFPGVNQFGQANPGNPKVGLEYNGWLYMSATESTATGQELFRFNMNTKQIQRLSDIAPGEVNSYPSEMVVFNDEIFFNANANGYTDAELWIYTPGTGGLRLVEIDPGIDSYGYPAGGGPQHLTEYNGYLYMRAQVVAEGVELRRYDPGTDDVELVFDSYPGQYLNNEMWYGNDGHTADLVLLNDKFYYTGIFSNRELWEYDPATDQGQQLVELFPGNDQAGNPNHGNPAFTTVFDGKLLFRGSSPAADLELFSVEITDTGPGIDSVPLEVQDVQMTKDGSDRPVLSWTLQVDPANRLRDSVRVFRSIDKNNFDFTINGAGQVANLGVGATTWTDTSGLGTTTYYYHVRPYNVIGLAQVSNMTVRTVSEFTVNVGTTNLNWLSIPYYCDYTKASDIVMELEGGLIGAGLNSKISAVGRWIEDFQFSQTFVYDGDFEEWGGTDFSISPGDGVYVVVTSNFDWDIVGGDHPVQFDFTVNGANTNVNWMTIPVTGNYDQASDIVLEIEGGLIGAGLNSKISAVGKWIEDFQFSQTFVYDGDFEEWGGTDFSILPGDGMYLVVTSDFSWAPGLV